MQAITIFTLTTSSKNSESMNNIQFEQIEQSYLDDLKIDYRLFVEQTVGAKHIHLASEDTNNAFMVAVPTRPTDSTGVAHILEHTTLCGSESFPVRDPFFMMLRRSLNTYMNAFTSTDCTAYPFATQNPKDFENLLAVYLDAVFFPILDPLDFAQEGWRLDFQEDQRGLAYKGVVYNEMKGAMSSPVAQLWQHLSTSLFPDTLYRFNSGGEPLEIPKLSHEQLKAFHRDYYHPSHAVFMTYGNLPAQRHQELIVENVLKRFTKKPSLASLPLQVPFSEAAELRVPYVADLDVSRKTHALWAWVLKHTAAPEDLLEAQFLSAIFLENSASPLRYLLETTPLADAPSELCGIDDSGQQLVFAAGVEGTDEENIEQLHRDIFAVFENVAQHGIDADILDGIIDSLEMSQRDLGGDNYPYGLQLMGRLLPACMYGGQPLAMLSLDKNIAELRAKAKDKNFVRDLVKQNLLDNPHRSRITMWPDPEKAGRDQAIEKATLAEIYAAQDDDDIAALREKIRALAVRQESPQNPDVLPTVTLEDVPKETPRVCGSEALIGQTQFDLYERATNGLFYANVVYDLSSLSADELRLLPFFTEFALELGSKLDDYTEAQKRRSRLGVFGAYASARNNTTSLDLINGRLVISAKGLARKSAALMTELAGCLPDLRIDEIERISDLIVQERVDCEASIIDRGHEIAMLSAAVGLTPSATLDDVWQGPTSILYSQDLEKSLKRESSLTDLCEKFAAIRNKLLAAPVQVLCVGEEKSLDVAREVSAKLEFNRASAAVSNGLENAVLALQEKAVNRAWLTTSQVNFCGKAFRTVPPDDAAVAPLLVLAKYLQDGFLHPAIREAGGAYGSGAQYDMESGSFRFFSYRDPRLEETLEDFTRSVDWLAGENKADRLQESILGVIRQLDKPKTPAGGAISAFYDEKDGVGYVFRKRLREQVLDTSYDHLLSVCERFLKGPGRISIVTDNSNIKRAESLGLVPVKLS